MSQEVYYIEEIIAYRVVDGQGQYLIKWVGYDEMTWEPADIIREDDPEIAEMYDAEILLELSRGR